MVPDPEGSLGMTLTEPYSVVGAITPWNFPLDGRMEDRAGAGGGNAVGLKPSEMTPFSALRMAELAVRAGIPAGLVAVVLGDGPTTGTALTGHPGIAKVSFTGSTGAGRGDHGQHRPHRREAGDARARRQEPAGRLRRRRPRRWLPIASRRASSSMPGRPASPARRPIVAAEVAEALASRLAGGSAPRAPAHLGRGHHLRPDRLRTADRPDEGSSAAVPPGPRR